MSTHSLATRALRGLLWNGGASVIQLGIMLSLYLVLDLADLGHFEWALMLVMFLALIGDLGLGSALVQYQEATETHFDSAFWTALAWGLLLTATVYAITPVLARYLGGDNPQAFAGVLRTFCFLIPFASVSGLFRARLQRDLNFSAIALSELVSVSSFGLVALALFALRPEIGVLLPVIAAISREFGLLASLVCSARWQPSLSFDSQALRQILSFALHCTGSRAVTYMNAKIAYFFIFLPLGATAQAHYTLVERLTLQPLTRLGTTIQRVSFPSFSTMQNDDKTLRASYMRAVQGLMLAMGPVLAGMFAFASEIEALIGRGPIATILRLLAAATFLKIIGTMVGSIFMAKGKANWSFYWSLFSMAVLIPAMYLYGLPRGIEGVALVVTASSLLFLLLSQYLTNCLIGLPFTAYLSALIRPGLVVASVLATLLITHPSIPGPPLVTLISGAALSILTTLAALYLIARDLCLDYWQSLRGR